MTADEYMPHELMIEILLRLPVISLLRFKCVCKSWFFLISHDPHFANLHFQITAATHTSRILMISTSTNETRSIDFEASLDDDNSVSAPLNLHFLPPGSCFDLQIKGSCRGFLLLHCSSTLYLWNPSTGFHKEIPLSPFGSNLDAEYFYGFGYDLSTDDYLLVSMSVYPSHLDFFSFRANTWKEIEGEGTCIRYVNPFKDEPKGGLLFNGAVHWIAFHICLRKAIILGFDLIEKKLFDMHLPDEFDRKPKDCGLWVFREFLSFWAMNYDNHTVEIWVMKEYKVNSSWTKTHVLPIDDIPTLYFSPLRSTKSGDIIGTDDLTGLVKYNDEAQLLGHRSYYNDPRGSQVAVYTESLLSLPGDNEQA